KQMVLSAAIDNGYIFIVLIAILTSVISAVYYLGIIKQIFFDKPEYKFKIIYTEYFTKKDFIDFSIFKDNNIFRLSSYLTFSISFFIFVFLFLLFDLEILLIYPYVVSAYTNDIYGLLIMLIFFLILTLGFTFELGKKALSIDTIQSKTSSKYLH